VALPPEIELRAADARREAAALAELQRASALVAYAGLFAGPFPLAETVERWLRFEGSVHVAESDGVPVGFVAASDAELDALYVAPERRGQGIGSALIALAPQAERLWVLERNVAARRFYERHGWRPDGEVKPGPEGLTELRYCLVPREKPVR
jgi:GNAT superfamily N-acetyltransferase